MGYTLQKGDMMEKQAIFSDKVAPPQGSYSHAIRVGQLLFIAGQVAVDGDGKLVGKGDPVAQTRQAMENIKNILEAAGAGFENVVKTNVYVLSMAERLAMGRVRQEYLKEPYPTSTLVEVKQLAHPDFLVEIEAIAAF